jgi:hypothetical protein
LTLIPAGLSLAVSLTAGLWWRRTSATVDEPTPAAPALG